MNTKLEQMLNILKPIAKPIKNVLARGTILTAMLLPTYLGAQQVVPSGEELRTNITISGTKTSYTKTYEVPADNMGYSKNAAIIREEHKNPTKTNPDKLWLDGNGDGDLLDIGDEYSESYNENGIAINETYSRDKLEITVDNITTTQKSNNPDQLKSQVNEKLAKESETYFSQIEIISEIATASLDNEFALDMNKIPVKSLTYNTDDALISRLDNTYAADIYLVLNIEKPKTYAGANNQDLSLMDLNRDGIMDVAVSKQGFYGETCYETTLTQETCSFSFTNENYSVAGWIKGDKDPVGKMTAEFRNEGFNALDYVYDALSEK